MFTYWKVGGSVHADTILLPPPIITRVRELDGLTYELGMRVNIGYNVIGKRPPKLPIVFPMILDLLLGLRIPVPPIGTYIVCRTPSARKCDPEKRRDPREMLHNPQNLVDGIL